MLPDGKFLEKVEWRSGEGGTAPDPKVPKDKVAAKLVRLAGMWRKGSLEKLLESAVHCSFIVRKCSQVKKQILRARVSKWVVGGVFG